MTCLTPTLSLRLLGNFALERDGQPCKLAYEKGRALLAYLALESARAHSRPALAELLWPDLAREAALGNLRLVLLDLRRALNTPGAAAEVLQVERQSVRLRPAGALQIDAAAFVLPLRTCSKAACAPGCNPCLAEMESLAGLYQGELMAGFALPQSQAYEEWLQVQRESLHVRVLGVLNRLAVCHEQIGDNASALSFAQRFLQLEPWNEESLRRVMRLLAANGDGTLALTTYHSSCQDLHRALGILFSEETHALARRIERGEPVLPKTIPTLVEATLTLIPAPTGQLRQVTVLYCELNCIRAEDPDAALALLRVPQARCGEIIRSAGGYLVQIHGGSLLAYFGYPMASENAARVAIQTALAVTRTTFAGLEVRVSVHSGMVITSDDPLVPDAIGATSGLAIRLRQLAQNAEVVMSAATHALVAGYFECSSLGLHPLPGSPRAQEVLRVLHSSGATSRLEAAATLTPLIGREQELAFLTNLWQAARRGVQHVVLLRGEAGIGKSRVVHTLKERLHSESCVLRELHCVAEHSNSPLHPWSAMLLQLLACAPGESPQASFERLAEFVEIFYIGQDQDAVALLAMMLGLPLRAPYRVPMASPQELRERTVTILLERLYALARQQPVLLVVEDLHWADPSTLEVIRRIVTIERSAPVFVMLTARPGFEPQWPDSLVTTLPLLALNDAQTAALVTAVAPHMAAQQLQQVVERADGIALFAEELARSVGADNAVAIPPTLQDLLMSRLDAMGSAKAVAQQAATIGRDFSLPMLQQITALEQPILMQALRNLQQAALVQQQADGSFHFRHALMRDAAYHSQTRAQREAAHRQIAVVLQAGSAEVRPELLAQHWAAGGDAATAAQCWIAAGKRDSQFGASQEAMAHFKAGLAVLEALAPGAPRIRLELDLQIGLGVTACATQGYASVEGAEAYARAMSLCGQTDGDADLFAVVWGLWASASSRTGYASALELARQLLRMASQSGDPVHQQQAHFAAGDTLFWQGDFAAAREHLEVVQRLYLPSQHSSHAAGFGEDAGVTSGAYLSWVLWFQGFPAQALLASERAVTLARELDHAFSLGYALTFAAILRCRLRQPDAALVLAQEALEVGQQHGFDLWKIGATLARGWALALQNDPQGDQIVKQCREMMRAAMGGVTLAVLGPLVDARVAMSLFADALDVNAEAIGLANAIGDHHIDAELQRLKGEALLGLDGANAAQAQSCFEQALAISRTQQARALELRAATSLARLWLSHGKVGEARCLLEEIQSWFTEGFDTTDFQESTDLLVSLAAGRC